MGGLTGAVTNENKINKINYKEEQRRVLEEKFR